MTNEGRTEKKKDGDRSTAPKKKKKKFGYNLRAQGEKVNCQTQAK